MIITITLSMVEVVKWMDVEGVKFFKNGKEITLRNMCKNARYL